MRRMYNELKENSIPKIAEELKRAITVDDIMKMSYWEFRKLLKS